MQMLLRLQARRAFWGMVDGRYMGLAVSVPHQELEHR
jgi:hypothetical protein